MVSTGVAPNRRAAHRGCHRSLLTNRERKHDVFVSLGRFCEFFVPTFETIAAPNRIDNNRAR
jgi:hypothetical protein